MQESSKGKSPCSDNQGAILELVSICQSVREYENEGVRRGTEDGVNRGMDDTFSTNTAVEAIVLSTK